jgi:hypothetical protein
MFFRSDADLNFLSQEFSSSTSEALTIIMLDDWNLSSLGKSLDSRNELVTNMYVEPHLPFYP